MPLSNKNQLRIKDALEAIRKAELMLLEISPATDDIIARHLSHEVQDALGLAQCKLLNFEQTLAGNFIENVREQ